MLGRAAGWLLVNTLIACDSQNSTDAGRAQTSEDAAVPTLAAVGSPATVSAMSVDAALEPSTNDEGASRGSSIDQTVEPDGYPAQSGEAGDFDSGGEPSAEPFTFGNSTQPSSVDAGMSEPTQTVPGEEAGTRSELDAGPATSSPPLSACENQPPPSASACSGVLSLSGLPASPTEETPTLLEVADLDADGRLDLVVANYNSETLSVLLGRGDGTFEAQQALSVSSRPSGLAVADLDGNGAPDIAATLEAGGISVFLNRGGAAFASSTSFASDMASGEISTGDLNRDSVLDLVTLDTTSDTVSVHFGVGDGTYKTPAIYTAGKGPVSLILVDLNADGVQDLVYVSSDTLGAGLVNVRFSDGSRVFHSPVSYGFEGSPRQVIAGDFDGTGSQDLAVLGGVEPPQFLLNAGDGTLAASPLLGGDAASVVAWRMFAPDLDADERPDLAFFGGSELDVVLNSESGIGAAVARYGVGSGAQDMVSADFNADGIMDLAVANSRSNNLSVLLGEGAGRFVRGDEYTLRDESSVPGEGPQMIVAAEFDDLPGLDLAVASYFGAAACVLFNDGTGGFGTTMQSRTGGQVESIAAGDWDGDGRLDLVVAGSANDGIDFVYNEADGIAVFPRIEYIVSGVPRAVAAADLNGDGFDDVAYAAGSGVVGVMLNSGSEEQWNVTELDVGGGPIAIQLADVDADAHPDLIVADDVGGVRIFPNDAEGGFSSHTDYAAGDRPRALAVADLDADGHVDLAVANHGSSNVSLLLNSGAGTFELGADYPVPGYPRSIVATDLDRDGDLDLVVASDFGETPAPGLSVSVLFNQGCRSFGPATNYYGYGAGAVGPYLDLKGAPHSLAAADLNDDGWVDLAIANGNHMSVLFGSCVE